MITGPERSGKRYTLKGSENEEKGLIFYASHDMLNLN